VDINLEKFPQFVSQTRQFLKPLENTPPVDSKTKEHLTGRLENMLTIMEDLFAERPHIEFSIG
jgi:hypothetical protein